MILLTGATGFLGSHLLYRLLAETSVPIKALYRTKSKIKKTEQVFNYYNDSLKNYKNLSWVQADLLNEVEVDEICKDVSQIYHCAASVSYNPGDKHKIIKNNIESTENIVHYAIKYGVKSFCYASSIAALGSSPEGLNINEETVKDSAEESSNYSYSKFKSEMVVHRGIVSGLNAVIVNPSVILGPYDWESGSSSIFKKIYNGFKFYTKGVTGYVDVRDVAHLMFLLTSKECYGEKFLVSAENRSYKELFDSIAEALKTKSPTIYARKNWLKAIAVADSIKYRITGKDVIITKETVKTAYSKSYYSARKVKKSLNYDFIPLNKTIQWTTECYMKSRSLSS